MRPYLKNTGSSDGRGEFALLVLVTGIYLALNALFTASWRVLIDREEASPIYTYHIFVPLLLSAMLFSVYYSIIRFADLRAEENERKLASVIAEQEHRRIRRDMEIQRERLHDTRQLLGSLSVIARSGRQEELLKYIDETMEHISIKDESFCADKHMNGILQYYASLAAASEIPFAAEARCSDLSALPETDLTLLLENAIRAAKEFRARFPQSQEGIRITADDSGSLLRIQIGNPCEKVSYTQADTVKAGAYLPIYRQRRFSAPAAAVKV